MSSDWFRKQRGWHYSLLPQGTWIVRRIHGQWSLFYLSMAVGSKTERHGEFTRLRAAKKYASPLGNQP